MTKRFRTVFGISGRQQGISDNGGIRTPEKHLRESSNLRTQETEGKSADSTAELNEAARRAITGSGEADQIVFQPSQEPIYIGKHPAEVERIVEALLSEARRAQPPGTSIKASVSRSSVADTFAEHCLDVAAGEYGVLALTDTGVGTEPDSSRLSALRDAARALGGNVTAHRIAGIGSVIRALFPVSRLESARVDSTVTDSGGTETILLVDDEAQVRQYLRDVLTESGYEVLDAENERDAILLASRYRGRIHLLLTDMGMPGRGGREIAAAIEGMRPGIVVLRMSGYAGNLGGPEQPAENQIVKPFGRGTLLRQIRVLLDAPNSTQGVAERERTLP
jgi:CheY-like chemotaxis protein